jgi:hypothetical protein
MRSNAGPSASPQGPRQLVQLATGIELAQRGQVGVGQIGPAQRGQLRP